MSENISVLKPVDPSVSEFYKDEPLLLKFATSINDALQKERLQPCEVRSGQFFAASYKAYGIGLADIFYMDGAIDLTLTDKDHRNSVSIEITNYNKSNVNITNGEQTAIELVKGDTLIQLSSSRKTENFRFEKVRADFDETKLQNLIHACLTTEPENFVDIPMKLQ